MAGAGTRRIVGIEAGRGRAADDTVVLDHDRRTRRRMTFTTAAGTAILLDQPRAAHLRDGDVLRLDDGGTVRVVAADETVTDIAAPSIATLVRIAWHLGNRHLPTQLLGNGLRIRHDHVIEAMVEGLGGACRTIDAPFDPERGAYDATPAAHHHRSEHDIARHDHGHHHHD